MNNLQNRVRILLYSMCIGWVFLGGCANVPKQLEQKSAVVERVTETALEKVTSDKYTISPADTLEIKFLYHPTFTDTQQVRPDGYVSLPLISDIQAAGKTPSELSSELKNLYSKELHEPDITVIVRGFESRKVYIGGEVRNPAMITLDYPKTVLQAIIQVGDVLPSAKQNQILLLRSTTSEKPEIMVIDLKQIRRGAKGDVGLEPYDVIFVPKTAIAQVNQFVEQYINNIVPRNVNFPFQYTIHSDIDGVVAPR